MMTPIYKIQALALALVAMFFFAACEKTENDMTLADATKTSVQSNPDIPNLTGTVEDRANGNSKIYPPNSNPGGMSHTDWTELWVQQFYTYDCENVPFINPENVLFYQTGPVYIMAGIAEVGGEANVSIPAGKAVLFPLINFWWDICPDELPAGMTPEEYLIPSIADLMALIDESSLSLTVDGDAVSNLSAYDFTTDVFEMTGNIALADCLDPCVTGDPQPIASGGYFVILKPMSPGQHTVHYHSEVPGWGFVQDGTYHITVQ